MRVILGASLLAVAAAFVGQPPSGGRPTATRHHGVRRARAPPNEALPGSGKSARPLVPAQRGGARLSATTAEEIEEAEAMSEVVPADVGSRMRGA